ncbi:hypothetical protein FRC11_001041, partial [Ceratobasidium sp. 423]
ISPFDRYHDASALEYWTKLSHYPDSDTIGHLALKLYRIFPSSVAEERTVSVITKLNTPDRGRQKASTLIQMTQIRQHFQPEEGVLGDFKKPRVAPTLRFRDMSDLFKLADKGIGSSTVSTVVDAEAHEPTASDRSADDEDMEVQELSPEEWEREAGFDDVVERVEGGSRDRFEVDGINLADPLLVDLLSGGPVLGVVERGAMPAKKRSAPTDAGSLMTEGSRKKFAPESFQF